MKIYHGSDKIVRKPLFGVGKKDNDYGSGFYTTEDIEKAQEWAIINGEKDSAYCNEYEIDTSDLYILELDTYGTLAWISEVAYNRGTDSKISQEIGNKLAEKYKVDTNNADIIIGYRADDSYIAVIEAFLLKKITINEVDKLFRKGELGKQVFVKSPKAFEKITFIGYEKVVENQHFGDNERKARQEVSRFLEKRENDIQLYGLDISTLGLTITDAINHDLSFQDGYYFVNDIKTDDIKENHHRKIRKGVDYDEDD